MQLNRNKLFLFNQNLARWPFFCQILPDKPFSGRILQDYHFSYRLGKIIMYLPDSDTFRQEKQ